MLSCVFSHAHHGSLQCKFNAPVVDIGLTQEPNLMLINGNTMYSYVALDILKCIMVKCYQCTYSPTPPPRHTHTHTHTHTINEY